MTPPYRVLQRIYRKRQAALTRELAAEHSNLLQQLPVTVHRPAFWAQTARGGVVAAAEAYMAKHWSSSDLSAVFKQCLNRPEALQTFEKQRSLLHRMQLALWRVRRNNAGRQWLENAAHHFDLGYEFFEMLQSDHQDRHTVSENAQSNPERLELENICLQLNPRPGDHVLDLSSDWGALTTYLAGEKHCRVTRVCHSRQHYEHIRHKVEHSGLSQQVTVLFEDFRDVHGLYDHIVCLDLLETLGQRASKQLLKLCSKMLKPESRLLLQTLCVNDDDQHQQDPGIVDFVRRYIYPGSAVPTTALWRDTSALGAIQLEDASEHYTKQIRAQAVNFQRAEQSLTRHGFDAVFQRLWRFHLSLRQAQLETGRLRGSRVLLKKLR